MLIVVGLYGVLWGKKKEMQVIGVVDMDEEETRNEAETKEENTMEELELSNHSIITVDQFPMK